MSSFKSSENIQKKERGPDRSVQISRFELSQGLQLKSSMVENPEERFTSYDTCKNVLWTDARPDGQPDNDNMPPQLL